VASSVSVNTHAIIANQVPSRVPTDALGRISLLEQQVAELTRQLTELKEIVCMLSE
ncbi:MAG: sensor histidine kinase regulating citrate/malate metabolism, partial [Paraglaciecola sp.]